MTRALSPRFAAILAAAEGQGWIARALARDEAEQVALRSGFTFPEALREIARTREAEGSFAFTPAPAHLSTKPEAAAEAQPESKPETAPATAPPPAPIPGLSPTRAATLLAALAADPGRSDRAIARELLCSPTLVGRARAAAGLASATREVRRGASAYAMRLVSD